MAGMVVLSAALRFLQEARADSAAAKLKAMIHVTATVVRDGKARELPLRDLVPETSSPLRGRHDPGDVRVIAAKDLFVSRERSPAGRFRGEVSRPDPKSCELAVELKKHMLHGHKKASKRHGDGRRDRDGSPHLFGHHGQFHHAGGSATSFDQGLSRFTWLMIQLMAVMVPLVFLIKRFTKHDWKSAFSSRLAVAVG